MSTSKGELRWPGPLRWPAIGAACIALLTVTVTGVARSRSDMEPATATSVSNRYTRVRTARHVAGTSAGLKASSGKAFAAFERSLPGPVGVAVLPVGSSQAQTLGDGAPAHGWSTTKVPVLVALLLATGPQGLSADQKAQAYLAITQSDNAAILELFSDLEDLKGGLLGASGYIQRLFRQSGDDLTVVATAPPPPGAATTVGQTEWSPLESVRFFSALANGCLLKPSPTRYVLGLMQQIEPSERWGIGAAGLTVPVAFKGGWGPESNGAYLVRQSGIIDPGTPDAVAVSIVAHPPAGSDSFDLGVRMVTQTAQWVAHHLILTRHVDSGCATGEPLK